MFALALAALGVWRPRPSRRRRRAAAARPQPERVINQSTDPLLGSFRFRSIGPASMGGRIDDIAVSESDPNVIYLGYAVGGVFKSENNGVVVRAGVPDLRHGVDWRHRDSSARSRTSSTSAPARRTTGRPPSFGDGIYKTTDGGKTFTNIGLKETQTIARIVIDPKNPETVYVASPGHLFGPNPERGVYKTTDGGKTWNLVKFIDNDTGFTDIVARSRRTAASSTRRATSGAAAAAASTAAARAARIWKTHGRGQDVDEADRQRAAARHLRPHRARRLALESERRLRADRSGRDRYARAHAAGAAGRRD